MSIIDFDPLFQLFMKADLAGTLDMRPLLPVEPEQLYGLPSFTRYSESNEVINSQILERIKAEIE